LTTTHSPVDAWHGLLRPDTELTPGFCDHLSEKLKAARLTFGDRIHCPFLRPFFLTEADERRVREVSELIARIGERVVQAALRDHALMDDLGLSADEERLVRFEPGYAIASTASRLDAFLLPDTLQFAEYNAESPAGLGYSETLAEVFQQLPVMDRFKERYDVRAYPLSEALLDALLASYRDWGGKAAKPLIGIVDWREVPTWSEFQILRERFERLGVPTLVADPRDLVFDGQHLVAEGRAIDLLYRRVLINDIVDRPAESAALVEAVKANAVCMANSFRCKLPHKKAFFAVLTDERHERLFSPEERNVIRAHVPWTRRLREGKSARDGNAIDLLPYARQHRENLVVKPNDEYGGHGVVLGWESSETQWEDALNRAVGDTDQAWIVQERIAVRREIFPIFDREGVHMRNMLVDLAPYLFRGRMAGFLTRLSSTSLANVTSGGGQVPSFVVRPRTDVPGE
jgi:uncharacterized circularly permuted ATP-grasp superfamily protein